MKVRQIEKVLLYNEGSAEELNIEQIAEYLREKLRKVQVRVRGNPLAFCPERSQDYARKFASIKIQDAGREIAFEQEPLYGEIEYEKRRILGKTRSFGILYEGFHLQRIFSEIVPREERSLEFISNGKNLAL